MEYAYSTELMIVAAVFVALAFVGLCTIGAWVGMEARAFVGRVTYRRRLREALLKEQR